MPRNEFHSELRNIARLLPREPIRPATVPLMRALMSLQARGRPDDVEVLTLNSGVQIRLHRPPGGCSPGPALLWIHGGGLVMGTAQQDDRVCRKFASSLGITVAAVNYRLAPQHRYPVARDDCYTALSWLADLPAVDRTRVAIGGASAGGGLAAALALHIRDTDDDNLTPAFQLLVYPMLDDRTTQAPGTRTDLRMWNARSNRYGWASYLGNTEPAIAVPARQVDLRGLPAAWIGVGRCDLFHDESLAYARRLKEAGVPCEVSIVDGAFHAFDVLAPKTSVAQAFFASQCAALRSALMTGATAAAPTDTQR